MKKQSAATEEIDLAELMGNLVHDFGNLITQQVDLLRAEVRQELTRTGGALFSMAAGGGLAAAGGLLSGLALVHLIHRITRLPLWCCYGAAAGACGAVGAALLRGGSKDLADVQLLPPQQTTAALEENLTWLKEQVNAAAAERPTRRRSVQK